MLQTNSNSDYTTYFFVIPDSNEEGLCNGAMSLSIKMEPPVSDKQDISIPEPLPATYSASQKEAIMEVPASSNEEDLQLFSRYPSDQYTV